MPNDTFVMTPGEIYHLDKAFVRAGFTPADVYMLRNRRLLSKVLKVIRGQAEIKIATHVIDCDADPVVPSGWKVEEHKKGGQIVFNPARVDLYLDADQMGSIGYIVGNTLRQRLADKPCLNANVLDYLLDYPELIPEEWKVTNRRIFFWGTIYRRDRRTLCVRHLSWNGCSWSWGQSRLDGNWYDLDPAAVSAG